MGDSALTAANLNANDCDDGHRPVFPLFEHSSLQMSLELAGLLKLFGNGGSITDPGAQRILFAWSEREVLLLYPEYAWLSVNEVPFVRLPVALSEAATAAQLASRQNANVPLELLVPLGQAIWSALQLEGSSMRAKWPEVQARMEHLERFCAMHWPDWFGGTFVRMADACYRRDATGVEEATGVLTRHLRGVAALQCLKPVLLSNLWAKEPSPILLTHQALRGYVTGLPEDRDDAWYDAVENLKGPRWWDELDTELAAAEARLRDMETSGFDPGSSLLARLRQALDALQVFQTRVPGLAAPGLTSMADAEDADCQLSVVVGFLRSIAGDAARLRDQLALERT